MGIHLYEIVLRDGFMKTVARLKVGMITNVLERTEVKIHNNHFLDIQFAAFFLH